MCLSASLFLFRKWKSSITTSGNYPLTCGYTINNDQTLIRHALFTHNSKVHIRYGRITSFEELEPAEAEKRKALYGIRRSGEGDERRAATSQLKHKTSAGDFVPRMVSIRSCSAVASGTAEESVTRRTHRNVSDNFTDVSEKLHRPLLADDTQSEAVTSTDDELFREAPEPLFPELSGVGDADELVVESEHAGTNKNLDPPCGGVTTTSAGRRSEHTSAGWGDQRPQRARTANVHTQTRVRTANIRMQVGSSINSAVKTADVQTEQTGEPLPKIPLLKPKVVTVELPAPPPQVITKTLYKDKIKIIQVIREVHHFADGTEETHMGGQNRQNSTFVN